MTELDLGSGRRALPKSPLTFEIVRPLTADDLGAIQNPPNSGQVVSLKTLRHSHHRLAELIAAGRPPVEISIITGYSPAYISSLKSDPAFAELVAHYEAEKHEVFADALERLKSIGLDALEKLHERINDPEKTWSNKELMELADKFAVQPIMGAKQQLGQGGAVASANLNLEVKFVGATPKDGPVIEGSFVESGGK